MYFLTVKKLRQAKKITLINEKAEVIFNNYSDWKSLNTNDYKETYDNYDVNSYGYIVFKNTNEGTAYSTQIISNYEVFKQFENSYLNYDDIRKAQEKYLKPIYYDLSNTEFNEGDLNKNYMFFLFEDIYNHINKHGLSVEFKDGNIPVSVITEYLQKYFDITEEDVIIKVLLDNKDIKYNKDKNTVSYEGGRGGGPLCLRIRNIEEKEGLKFIVYQNYDYMTAVPTQCNLLTVKDLPDESFYYISNKKLSKVNDKSNSDFKKEITEVLKKSVDTFFLYRGDMDCNYDEKPLIINEIELFPSVGFSSKQELKDYTETVFSQRFAKKIFYYHAFASDEPMMKEENGKLYVYNGGMGWCYSFIFETLMVESIAEDEAIFTIDSSIVGEAIQTHKFKAIKENGKWVLDSFYDFQ